MSIWRRYSYGWITGGLFLFSLAGHFVFGAIAGQRPAEIIAEILANWQSEFLQLLWQVGGMSFLLYVGSSQSRNESDRLEAKIDTIARRVGVAGSELTALDHTYERR